jgi:periplasmic protein TonB
MFEHSLIGLEAKPRSRRAWISLPVAILLHLAALATFTFAGYWHINEVPEPSVNVVFFTSAPPPPPPPVRGSGRPETETKPTVKPPVPQPAAPTQPTVVPDQTPAATSPVVDNVADLPPNGDPRGSEHGVDHGDPSSGVDYSDGPSLPTVVAPPTPVDDRPIVVGGAVKKPEILSRIEPRYTEAARMSHTEGVVVLQAIIDEQGFVTGLKVLRSLPMGLDQAALDAVRQWRFKPATLEGRAVKVYFNLTVNFKIQR